MQLQWSLLQIIQAYTIKLEMLDQSEGIINQLRTIHAVIEGLPQRMCLLSRLVKLMVHLGRDTLNRSPCLSLKDYEWLQSKP